MNLYNQPANENASLSFSSKIPSRHVFISDGLETFVGIFELDENFDQVLSRRR